MRNKREFQIILNDYYTELRDKIVAEYKDGINYHASVVITGFLGLDGGNNVYYKMEIIHSIVEKLINTNIVNDLNLTEDNIEIKSLMEESEKLEGGDWLDYDVMIKVSWIDKKEKERYNLLRAKIESLLVEDEEEESEEEELSDEESD